ncbi:hypothetical protein F751_5825 [Auxenochlorella protothecoides]|uniref:Transcription factor Iwr1 domain-containing protein n=1 Tax=Auxenochlorella protothecoides TaxID=3075 RepID=A0A087SDG4_AUXPR|nr:hypothetical protein F751_5825 [Auxenochlorella protothecoides]KFM23768.1 hypothetical protein F751_5825 [Auxenochlorella protothecoides]
METTNGLTDHFGGVGIHDSQQRQRRDGSKRFRFVRLSNVNAGDLSSLTREGAWDPSAQVPHEDPVDEDGYVMDVYAALPAAAEDEQEETDAAWEAHLAGRAPVVQASRIMDDGTWLVHQSSDRDDTSQDSQDSNAEGHFAHDYPDEYSASTDSGDYDPDLGYFPPTRHRRRHMGSSSGSSSDEDACRTGLRSKDDGRRHFY